MKTLYFHSKLLCRKAMLRQIGKASTKWTYHKEWSFASNCSSFLENFSSFRTSSNELIWCTSNPNVHIRIFRWSWSLILVCFFPVSIFKFGSHCNDEMHHPALSPAIDFVGTINGLSSNVHRRVGRSQSFDIQHPGSWHNHMSFHLCRKRCDD